MEQDEIKKAVAAAVASALEGQTQTLVAAMVRTNKPLESRLDAVNAHLKELNGKVATHQAAHAVAGARMDGFKDDIARIDRRIYQRRESDKEDTGENRKLTMFHFYIALGSIVATVLVLKFFGLLK